MAQCRQSVFCTCLFDNTTKASMKELARRGQVTTYTEPCEICAGAPPASGHGLLRDEGEHDGAVCGYTALALPALDLLIPICNDMPNLGLQLSPDRINGAFEIFFWAKHFRGIMQPDTFPRKPIISSTVVRFLSTVRSDAEVSLEQNKEKFKQWTRSLRNTRYYTWTSNPIHNLATSHQRPERPENKPANEHAFVLLTIDRHVRRVQVISGRVTLRDFRADASQAERLGRSCLSIARPALSLARSAPT
ncbi:hypothetical protein EVAR_58981_1 [Eumeta japonica]|uniref:Uncharacterized protein n=1 Tax=Eumeta variegata TaxID=151549 RepID=A0A4C1YHF8_EUMVA|nr:hypothetical protein EVAR_58981_1 [Eumeta japonica]